MTKSSTPPRRSPSPEGPEAALHIEIDPDLIEEALAAVERGARPGPAAAEARGNDEIEISLDGPAPARPPDATADERARLHHRVREQADVIRRLEKELAATMEARDGFDRQLRELRTAWRDQSTDFEKFRARARKDVDEAERRGEDRALRPLAEIYDNVERAWTHAVSDPAQILSGLQIIVEQFKRLLARMGLERVEAERGMLFDPEVHEAVLYVHDDLLLPGTIVHEVNAGFRLRGRLFRPARVTVSAPAPGARD
jgi:molecular chaperone GrpE